MVGHINLGAHEKTRAWVLKNDSALNCKRGKVVFFQRIGDWFTALGGKIIIYSHSALSVSYNNPTYPSLMRWDETIGFLVHAENHHSEGRKD